MARILDKSYNKDTGELEQFTVLENGRPSLVKATNENVLLYDPEDELPFDGGLRGLLEGDEAVVFSEEPDLLVAPTSNRYCFLIRYKGKTVETTPSDSDDVLTAIRDAIIDGDNDSLVGTYHEIKEQQVRRDLMNAVMQTFDEDHRISESGRGWLVDDFYLVDWSANLYTKNDDPSEEDIVRSGGSVESAGRTYEFIEGLNTNIEPVSVGIGGQAYQLTEREMLFLAKVRFLLDRREYHDDVAFWAYADKRAAVDHKTGEPVTKPDEEDDDRPDVDTFNA